MLYMLVGDSIPCDSKKGNCRFNLSMQHPFQLSLSVF
ncbi:tail assembly protein of prophage CP-933T [Escherichia coli]|nr:tail assembly protein of prophage CP-933T [Escherichia coli]